MCVSALPWMFMPIWSRANESPPDDVVSPVSVILCRAGAGLSAVTPYSMGQARDTVRPTFTPLTAASVVAGVR
jgi:hypothetical protein